MLLKVRFLKNWRGVRRMFYTDSYRVPGDVSEDEAQRAIAEGVAIVEKTSAPPAALSPKLTDPPDDTVLLQPGPKRYARKKKPAPENKARGEAPEDKFTLG